MSVLQVVPNNCMATSTIERLPIFPLGHFRIFYFGFGFFDNDFWILDELGVFTAGRQLFVYIVGFWDFLCLE